MNETQVESQIQQLVSFIHQEAEDKAKEIRAKAEEQFNINKLSAVQNAREKIRVEHEKRTKKIEVNRKIAQSTEMNAARLQILKAQDAVLREAVDEAGAKLAALAASDAGKYSELVGELILQGLVLLGDDEVAVRCRQADVEVVDSSLDAVTEKYLTKTGTSVKLSTDKSNFLPDNSAGGVVLSSLNGTITVDNTFESRLEIAYNQNLPKIRQLLFAKA